MKKLLFTSLSCFILLGFLNSASAATTVISTANESTTIVSDPTSGTYTPGSAIQVYITSIATNDPYVTNVSLTGDGTTIYNGGVPVYNVTTTVGTAGAPAASVSMAMNATVTTNVPTAVYTIFLNVLSGAPAWASMYDSSWNTYTINSNGYAFGSITVPAGSYTLQGVAYYDENNGAWGVCPSDMFTGTIIGATWDLDQNNPNYTIDAQCGF